MKKLIMIMVVLVIIVGCMSEDQIKRKLKGPAKIEADIHIGYSHLTRMESIVRDIIIKRVYFKFPHEVYGQEHKDIPKDGTYNYGDLLLVNIGDTAYFDLGVELVIEQIGRKDIIIDTLMFLCPGRSLLYYVDYDIRCVNILDHTWGTKNNVVIHDCIIKNDSKYPVKKINFKTEYISKRDIPICEKLTMVDVDIEPHSNKKVIFFVEDVEYLDIANTARVNIHEVYHTRK